MLGRAFERGRPFMLVAALRAPIDGRVPRRIWVGTDALERKRTPSTFSFLTARLSTQTSIPPQRSQLSQTQRCSGLGPARLRAVQTVRSLPKLAEITHYPRDLRRCSACL